MKCYIICNKHPGLFGNNWLKFWGPNHNGYTQDIRNAGIYESAENEYPLILTKEDYYSIRCNNKKLDNYYIPVELIKKEYKEFHLIEI